MIEIASGNLLAAPVEALVNTVNTQGVMGKGIALQFKQAYPQMYRDYERACKAGEVALGKMHVFDLGGLVGGPRWIINFPTKGHWRAGSKLGDVESGLNDLVAIIKKLQIHSIAVPPLGCGNGGLDWSDVRPRIETALSGIPDLQVLLYAPAGAPASAAMPNRTERSRMTLGQAALVGLMNRYLKGLLDPFVSLLEVHKLMYFLKAAGEPLPKLIFQKALYGPYSPNLHQSLIRMEGHLTRGFGEGTHNPKLTLELMPGAVDETDAFLIQHEDTKARIERVGELIQGFEDPYGMELLSSVHWVMQHESPTLDADSVVRAVHAWNARKKKTLKAEHLRIARDRFCKIPGFFE